MYRMHAIEYRVRHYELPVHKPLSNVNHVSDQSLILARRRAQVCNFGGNKFDRREKMRRCLQRKLRFLTISNGIVSFQQEVSK